MSKFKIENTFTKSFRLKQKNIVAIIPIAHEKLSDAVAMIRKIFPYQPDQKNARYNLAQSLIRPASGKSYWLAINDEGRVVGITGLYDDRSNSTIVWLGWFGVSPEWRKQGVGSALLQFAIDEAKRRGFSTLKLYTSTDKNERAAHTLYRRFGFTQYRSSKKVDKIYFMKRVDDNGSIYGDGVTTSTIDDSKQEEGEVRCFHIHKEEG